MRGHLSPAVSSHKSDLWHSPMGQVTGLGLDLWQPHSGNPAEVKSGICFDVSVSHPCDDEAPQASMPCTQLRTVCVCVCSIRPHAWHRPTGMFVVSVLASLKGSLPCHLSLSLSLSVRLSRSIPHTPSSHYIASLYCSYPAWLKYSLSYSLAMSVFRLEPTGLLLCLISSVWPVQECVTACLLTLMWVYPWLTCLLCHMSVFLNVYVPACLRAVHSLSELWLYMLQCATLLISFLLCSTWHSFLFFCIVHW